MYKTEHASHAPKATVTHVDVNAVCSGVPQDVAAGVSDEDLIV